MTDKLSICNDLQYGEIDLEGQFLHGSNGTFLVNVKTAMENRRAVYKPKAGEQPLWDFPFGTLYKREVATYLFSESLEWDLVPHTVHRKKAPLGPGSLQVFIPHDPQNHYYQLSEIYEDIRRRVLLFDFMLNNADRKAGHFIVDSGGHVWLIDHGLTFHVDDKLRTVAWDHAGEIIPRYLLEDIHRVYTELKGQSECYDQLSSLLSSAELIALTNRIKKLVAEGLYPLPPTDRRVVPWPPI
jgi:hypothetical protein